jgi:DNA-binding NtrC family response regulator
MSFSSSSPKRCESSSSVVLLVEDHDGYRRIVRQALECFLPAWTVCEADSVLAAKEVLRTGEVTVVVCDLTLPDGSATDLVGLLPSLTTKEPRVIIFSNHSAESLESLRGFHQVHDCLTKERGLKELASIIEHAAAYRGPVKGTANAN